MFVFKLCLWRKTLVWSEAYFLSSCCLGDLAVISTKLNDLETQMRSQQTARKNQLNGRGCGKTESVHRHTHILMHMQACKHTAAPTDVHASIHRFRHAHTHTLCKHKNTPSFPNKTFFRPSCFLPEQLHAVFVGKMPPSIQVMCREGQKRENRCVV